MQNEFISLIRLDLILETVAAIIALMISHYANRGYRLSGQKRLSDLSTGFLVLSAAMFGRVIGTLYFFVLTGTEGAEITMGVVIVIHGVMRMMAYVIFAVSTRRAVRGQEPALVLLLALPILTSPPLEIIAVVVLLVVVLQALMNYLAVRNFYALYVLIGFSLLLFSHGLALFSQDNVGGYLLSQALQLLGLIAFLILLNKAGKEE
ncbi:MAG: hypothetical protein ACXAB6_10305 [Candidatus Thorarchaeota archaeon]|jgi:hypothetical protein